MTNLYQRVFETAQDGILILDFPEGRIMDANPFLLSMIGYDRDALIGKRLWEIGFIEDKQLALDAFEALKTAGVVRYENIDLRSRSGQRLAVEFVSNRYQHDGVWVVQCNVRDISERVHLAQTLQASHAREQQLHWDTVTALSFAIESRDPYTAGHQSRVSHLATAIGQQLGLSEAELEGIRLAALVHDIGKIAIPAELLVKPTALTDLEFQLLQTHVTEGHRILSPLRFPWPLAEIVLQHHERLDGSGYPRGLQGEAICLAARIIMVADTIESMVSHRPYRAALSLDAALAVISDGRSLTFDPTVVDACLELFQHRGYALPQRATQTRVLERRL